MKSLLFLVVSLFIFTGCSSNKGIMVNTANSTISQDFQIGTVISSKKVLLDDSNYATTMGGGALAGAGLGAIIGSRDSGKRAGKGALIGGAVGALAGAAYNKATDEKEAYEITVQMNNGNTFTAHVNENIQVGQKMSFIIRPDGTVSNLDRADRRLVN